MRKPNPNKQPTWTSLVLGLLQKSDDFLNLDQVTTGVPSGNYNQITAALAHLQKRGAIEVIDSGNRLWWFATPEGDTRVRTLDERAPEPKGNRTRGRKIAGTNREPK